MKYLTLNPDETKKLGQTTAKRILENNFNKNKAFIIGLQGDLGGGKTTFLQGFAKGLGVREKILSPTFILIKKFEVPSFGFLKNNKNDSHGFKFFYHLDCYRISKPEEILTLGFKEIIFNPENIVAIEWPEKIKKYLPQEVFLIKFKFKDAKKREIIFSK